MPDKERMTFIYLSGAGTSPDGKQFWQQVKSKTEAEIQTKGFRRVFALRPAIMKWAKGQKHIQTMQYFFLPFYPVLRLLGQANNMREIALSQLALVRHGLVRHSSPTTYAMLIAMMGIARLSATDNRSVSRLATA